jgi:hypothetical protein
MMQSISGDGNNLSLFNFYAAVVIGVIFCALSFNTYLKKKTLINGEIKCVTNIRSTVKGADNSATLPG